MADFATVAELETYLGAASGSLGARGTAMLHDASSTIRAYCQQDLEVVTGRQESYAGDAWRFEIRLTQRPVTAVSAITVDAVAFTDFLWDRWGRVIRTDTNGAWDTGPILVTYDSGYATTSYEYDRIKTMCKDCAARAIGGPPETSGFEQYEARGFSPAMYLTDEEKRLLDGFGLVMVG